MDEDKGTKVTWGINEGIKFGFGFSLGMFLWVVVSMLAFFFIIDLLFWHALGWPNPNPFADPTTVNVSPPTTGSLGYRA
jgi:hypothetical protein